MESLKLCGLIAKKHTAVKLICDSDMTTCEMPELNKFVVNYKNTGVIRLSSSIASVITKQDQIHAEDK